MMFKAKLLKDGSSIWFKDKRSKNRTIGPREALGKCIADSRDCLRENIETIIGMRDSAQHFITPEYASFMNPLFLANVDGFCKKYNEYFGVCITDSMPRSYITLFVPDDDGAISKEVLESKYGRRIAKDIVGKSNYVQHLCEENSKGGMVDGKLAVTVEIQAKIIKDPSKADMLLARTPNSQGKVKEIKVATDSSIEFPHSYSAVVREVTSELNRRSLSFTPTSQSAKKVFNTNTLNLYIKSKSIKRDPVYSYKHLADGKVVKYTYSRALIERIVDDISDDPDLFVKMANPAKNQNG